MYTFLYMYKHTHTHTHMYILNDEEMVMISSGQIRPTTTWGNTEKRGPN